MTLTTRFILSVLIVVVSIGLGMLTLYVATDGSALKAEKMASEMGGLFAVIASLGVAALWLPWAYRLGKKKRGSRSIDEEKEPTSK